MLKDEFLEARISTHQITQMWKVGPAVYKQSSNVIRETFRDSAIIASSEYLVSLIQTVPTFDVVGDFFSSVRLVNRTCLLGDSCTTVTKQQDHSD